MIKIKNKKAEDSRPVPVLIGAIIAVFILVIVFLFFFKGGGGLIDNVKTIFPSFNNTVEASKEIQIIGYDISSDKVKYYDGQTWIEIEGDLVYKDKTLRSADLKEDFTDNYYYDSEKRETKKISLSTQESLELQNRIEYLALNNCLLLDRNFAFDLEDRSKIRVDIVIKDLGECQTSKIIGRFILKGEKMSFVRGNEHARENGVYALFPEESHLEDVTTEWPELHTKIKKISDEWKDEILKQTITIRYIEKTPTNDPRTFCAEKIGPGLVVNLQKPAEKCP